VSYIAIASNENTWAYEKVFRIIADNIYDPNFLLADGAEAITAGMSKVSQSLSRSTTFSDEDRLATLHEADVLLPRPQEPPRADELGEAID